MVVHKVHRTRERATHLCDRQQAHKTEHRQRDVQGEQGVHPGFLAKPDMKGRQGQKQRSEQTGTGTGDPPSQSIDHGNGERTEEGRGQARPEGVRSRRRRGAAYLRPDAKEQIVKWGMLVDLYGPREQVADRLLADPHGKGLVQPEALSSYVVDAEQDRQQNQNPCYAILQRLVCPWLDRGVIEFLGLK
jgi:hypothetical protein